MVNGTQKWISADLQHGLLSHVWRKSDPKIRTMRKALAIYSCWISSCQDPFMKAQTACHWCVSKLGSPVNCDITEVYVQFWHPNVTRPYAPSKPSRNEKYRLGVRLAHKQLLYLCAVSTYVRAASVLSCASHTNHWWIMPLQTFVRTPLCIISSSNSIAS